MVNFRATQTSRPPAPPLAAEAIPESQRQALERKHALDEQQRAFEPGHAMPPPPFSRRRPPG